MTKSFNREFFEQLEKNRLKRSLLEQPFYVKDTQAGMSLMRQLPLRETQNACNNWIRSQLEKKPLSDLFLQEEEKKEQTFYDEI